MSYFLYMVFNTGHLIVIENVCDLNMIFKRTQNVSTIGWSTVKAIFMLSSMPCIKEVFYSVASGE